MAKNDWRVMGRLRRIKNNNRRINHLVSLPYMIRPWMKERCLHARTDVYIISFPKCGRTWLRLIIGKYIERSYGLKDVPKNDVLELTPLSRYMSKIPMIRVTHDDDPHKKVPSEISSEKNRYRRKRVLFLVRDPRDAIVSLFFQFLKREKLIENMNLDEFARREDGSLKSLIRFYNIWEANRMIPKEFLMIKYEDLHRKIYEEKDYKILHEILRFVGIKNVDNEVLSWVVNFTTFDNMKRMERRGEFKSEMNRLVPANENDAESYKVRKGVIGGYKNYCEERTIEYMNKVIEDELSEHFRYSRSSTDL